MMNLLQWRLLIAVADTGNITRGAESVGITQSGASQAIAQLEVSLGFKIFVRERRDIKLTTLGEQVIVHARSMLNSLDSIRLLSNDSRGLTGGASVLPAFLR